MEQINKSDVFKFLPSRNEFGHKGDFGKVFLIGGSKGLTGSVTLSSIAALRCGSGLVTVGIPESLNSIFEVKLTEVMSCPLEDTNGNICELAAKKMLDFSNKCDITAFGMGIGRNYDITNLLECLVDNYSKPLLIDADGLYALSKRPQILSKADKVIITPHTAEFSRLTGYSSEYINNNREKTATEFARKFNCTVLLKGKNTVVSDGNRIFINPTGNSGMATAGSGDVLSGIISSFIGQKVNIFEAACLGAYIHGLAGDCATRFKNEYSIIATDIIDNISNAINIILQGE